MTPARLKMKELERATGVGREAIRYYIREGLLPEPERAGRNVAYYDPSFVERITLIKELQRKRYLPLHVIRSLVDSDKAPPRAEVRALLEIDGRLFPAVAGGGVGPERLGEVARRTGVLERDIRKLAALGILELAARDGAEWLEETGIRILELWGRMRQAGFSEELGFLADHFHLYRDFVQWLAREELRIFSRGIAKRVDRARAVHMAEEGIDCLNQIIALLRKATLLRYIREGNVPSASARARRPGRTRRRA